MSPIYTAPKRCVFTHFTGKFTPIGTANTKTHQRYVTSVPRQAATTGATAGFVYANATSENSITDTDPTKKICVPSYNTQQPLRPYRK